MSRLDRYLDEESRNMTIALSMRPECPSDETQAMVARYRDAMRHSLRGRTLDLEDRLDDLVDALPWVLRVSLRTWARLLGRLYGP